MEKHFFLCVLVNLLHCSCHTYQQNMVPFLLQMQQKFGSDVSLLQNENVRGLVPKLVQNCSVVTYTKASRQIFKITGKHPLMHIFHVKNAKDYLSQARQNHALGSTHIYVMIGQHGDKLNKYIFKDVVKLIWLQEINTTKLMIKKLKCDIWSTSHTWTSQGAKKFKFNNLFQRFRFCQEKLFSIPAFAVTANNLFLLNNPLTNSREFHGFEKSMVEEIGKDVGFQIKLSYRSLGDINGTDALGLVYSGKSEMTMGFLSLTHTRSRYFAFTYPHEESAIGMFIQRPNPLAKWLAMVWPLDKLTWLTISISVLVFTLFFWIWLGPRGTSIFGTFGVTLSFILKKGLTGYHLNGRLKTHKTRLFLLGWIISVLFLKIWYKTTLRAVLISPWRHSRPETMEDVLKLKPTVFVLSSGASDKFLSNLDVPVFRELRNSPNYKRIQYKDLPDVMRLVQSDASNVLINGVMSNYQQTLNQVFNLGNNVHKIYSYEEQTGLMTLKETIRLGSKSFLVRKNAPYVDRMSELIMSMASHGLIKKWDSDAKEAIKWNNHLLVKHGKGEIAEFLEEPRWRVISTDMLRGVFLFLGISCGLSTIILLYEIGYCAVHS